MSCLFKGFPELTAPLSSPQCIQDNGTEEESPTPRGSTGSLRCFLPSQPYTFNYPFRLCLLKSLTEGIKRRELLQAFVVRMRSFCSRSPFDAEGQ